MKKILVAVLALMRTLAVSEAALAADPMTYAEYAAAAMETEVTVKASVQLIQAPKDGKVSIFAADADGAYFIYDVDEALVEGKKPGDVFIATGYKGEWAGEAEVIDVSSLEFVEEEGIVAEAADVTDLLGQDALIEKMNQKVAFKGMTVAASKIEGDDTEYAFLYNWDGSGAKGDDLYFYVTKDGQTFQFTVENREMDQDSETYQAVEALQVGDVIDLEGFLYWYNGANPHITLVTKAE